LLGTKTRSVASSRPRRCRSRCRSLSIARAVATVTSSAAKLRKLIAQLPPKEAHVFCLRYFNDMGNGQIAKQLGIKRSTAGVLLHRARAKLGRLLSTGQQE
jgi:RNA polymerase sigma-70 factor (ECF subfamily)